MKIYGYLTMKKSNWHGGKGSARRNSNEQAYSDNWETIFGKSRPNINTRNKEVKNGKNKTGNSTDK